MLNFETLKVFAVALKLVRRRCPHLNDEELQDAANAWIDYMKVVWRIHERVEAEEEPHRLDLRRPKMGFAREEER